LEAQSRSSSEKLSAVGDDLLDVKGVVELVGKRVGKDQDRGKLTFPALWGIEESQRRAEQLVQAACDAVSDWDGRADVLIGLAQYVLERNR